MSTNDAFLDYVIEGCYVIGEMLLSPLQVPALVESTPSRPMLPSFQSDDTSPAIFDILPQNSTTSTSFLDDDNQSYCIDLSPIISLFDRPLLGVNGDASQESARTVLPTTEDTDADSSKVDTQTDGERATVPTKVDSKAAAVIIQKFLRDYSRRKKDARLHLRDEFCNCLKNSVSVKILRAKSLKKTVGAKGILLLDETGNICFIKGLKKDISFRVEDIRSVSNNQNVVLLNFLSAGVLEEIVLQMIDGARIGQFVCAGLQVIGDLEPTALNKVPQKELKIFLRGLCGQETCTEDQRPSSTKSNIKSKWLRAFGIARKQKKERLLERTSSSI